MRRFLRRLWEDDRGVETFEWIALALVFLVLLGIVWEYLKHGGGKLVATGLTASIQGWLNRLTGGPSVPSSGGGPSQGGGAGSRPSGSGYGSSFGWGNGSPATGGSWSSSGHGAGSGYPGSGASSGGHSFWSSIGHGIHWFLQNGGPVGSAITHGFRWFSCTTPWALFSSHTPLLDKAGALAQLGTTVGLTVWGGMWAGRILSVAGGWPWLGSLARTAAVGTGNAILDGIGSVAGGLVGAGETGLGLVGSAAAGVAHGIGWIAGKAADAAWAISDAVSAVKDGLGRLRKRLPYMAVSYLDGMRAFRQGAWGAVVGIGQGAWNLGKGLALLANPTTSPVAMMELNQKAGQIIGSIGKAYRQGKFFLTS